jgi:hypothetical protein
MPGWTITAQSTPVKDTWGFGDYWSCNDWIRWHQLMKKEFGLQQANIRFVQEFEDQEIAASGFNCQRFNSAFRDYARDNEFLAAISGGILGTITTPIGVVIDLTHDVGSVVSNVSDSAVKTTEIIKKLIPLLLILVLVFVGVYAYKKLAV